MTDLDGVITISPLQPTTGPLSRQAGSGMPIQSLAGMKDPVQGFMIVNEAIQMLQDQIDSLKQILGLSPSVSAINFPLLIITDLQFTNNSPGAGRISWTACTIYYNGNIYGISAGNCLSTDTLVWWVVGESSFRSGTAFTPNQTTFPIATNTSGTADIAYNKIGANSIQETNVIGGFTSGYAPQNPSDTTPLAGNSTTLLNYTGAGGIVSVGITDASGGTTAAGSAITLSITFDGGTTQSYTIKGPSGGGSSNLWSSEVLNCVQDSVGSGTAAGDRVVIPFGVAFKTSCVITLNHTGGLSNQLSATVSWAKKL